MRRFSDSAVLYDPLLCCRGFLQRSQGGINLVSADTSFEVRRADMNFFNYAVTADDKMFFGVAAAVLAVCLWQHMSSRHQPP